MASIQASGWSWLVGRLGLAKNSVALISPYMLRVPSSDGTGRKRRVAWPLATAQGAAILS